MSSFLHRLHINYIRVLIRAVTRLPSFAAATLLGLVRCKRAISSFRRWQSLSGIKVSAYYSCFARRSKGRSVTVPPVVLNTFSACLVFCLFFCLLFLSRSRRHEGWRKNLSDGAKAQFVPKNNRFYRTRPRHRVGFVICPMIEALRRIV